MQVGNLHTICLAKSVKNRSDKKNRSEKVSKSVFVVQLRIFNVWKIWESRSKIVLGRKSSIRILAKSSKSLAILAQGYSIIHYNNYLNVKTMVLKSTQLCSDIFCGFHLNGIKTISMRFSMLNWKVLRRNF